MPKQLRLGLNSPNIASQAKELENFLYILTNQDWISSGLSEMVFFRHCNPSFGVL
jgi:hypothetical protein